MLKNDLVIKNININQLVLFICYYYYYFIYLMKKN